MNESHHHLCSFIQNSLFSMWTEIFSKSISGPIQSMDGSCKNCFQGARLMSGGAVLLRASGRNTPIRTSTSHLTPTLKMPSNKISNNLCFKYSRNYIWFFKNVSGRTPRFPSVTVHRHITTASNTLVLVELQYKCCCIVLRLLACFSNLLCTQHMFSNTTVKRMMAPVFVPFSDYCFAPPPISTAFSNVGNWARLGSLVVA